MKMTSGEEWQNDGDIVASAVRGQVHVDWWDLSDDLKFDTRVTAVVFKLAELQAGVDTDLSGKVLSLGNPADVMLAALQYESPAPSLHHNDEFFNNDTSTKSREGSLWSKVPPEWLKNHKGLALHGVTSGYVSVDDCPCLVDRALVKSYLERNVLRHWEHVPPSLRTDIDFARSIQKFPSTFMVVSILNNFPQLRSDLEFWRRFVQSANNAPEFDFGCDYIAEIIVDDSSREILSDRQLMIDACHFHMGEVFGHADAILKQDHDFVFSCVDRYPFLLCQKISKEVLRLFPDILHHGLSRLRDFDVNYDDYSYDEITENLPTNVPPEFWEDRAFVLRWFECGMPFPSDDLDPFRSWKKDEEIFLLVARHCRTEYLYRSFGIAALSLRNNKRFMLRVLETRSSLLKLASPRLRHDFDLCLVSYSDPTKTKEDLILLCRGDSSDWSYDEYSHVKGFLSQMKTELEAHNTFCSLVLPAISLLSVDSGCTLAALNQGAATSAALKKRIAAYVNLPTGKRLRRLRQARTNLEEMLETYKDLYIEWIVSMRLSSA